MGDNLIIGTARFVAPKTIEVATDEGTTRLLTAERLFINTGTRPLIPSVPGLKEAGFLTSESIMELEQLPEHLIVLGSGYIGLEFAQMFRRFGSSVTVIGQSEQILSQQDPHIAIASSGASPIAASVESSAQPSPPFRLIDVLDSMRSLPAGLRPSQAVWNHQHNHRHLFSLPILFFFCQVLFRCVRPVVPVPLDASSLVKIVTLCIRLTKGVKTLGATVLVILKAKQP